VKLAIADWPILASAALAICSFVRLIGKLEGARRPPPAKKS
jgi:hypothetical protein